MFDPDSPSDDYTLRWPPAILDAELAFLNSRTEHGQPEWEAAAEHLLGRAFASDIPVEEFRRRKLSPASRGLLPAQLSPQVFFMNDLASVTQRLPVERAKMRYSMRVGGGTRGGGIELAKAAWLDEVTDLLELGCFDRRLGIVCPRAKDRGVAMADFIARELEDADLVFGLPETWSDNEFFDMVETLHDASQHPRRVVAHSPGPCPGHYKTFSISTGQAIYRWRVNEVMTRCQIGYRVAGKGEDLGRVVKAPEDPRADLADELADPSVSGAIFGDKVAHAIVLFRGREATREDKVSACLALAGVLEDRKQILDDNGLSADEQAFKHIANRFALRHQNREQQRGDYDNGFLDWLFWMYLASVELTNTLIARQGDTDDC